MSGAPSPQDNPYQAPQQNLGAFPGVDTSGLDRSLIKKFRDQIHALGALWIIFGAIAAGVGAFVVVGAGMGLMGVQGAEIPAFLPFLILGLGVMWVVVGVFTCVKQMWAVYVGLGLSYLSLIGNLIQLQVCAVIILVLIILQAHRVLGFAKKLTAAGVPLTAKP